MAQAICDVCGLSRHPRANFCPDCTRLLGRLDTRKKHSRDARIVALKNSFRGSHFYCHYTGWELTISDSTSPFYLTWDHRTPRDESDIVVAAAVINDVKYDLTEDEFRTLVIGLAERFRDPAAVVPRLNTSHYRRSAPQIATGVDPTPQS